MKHYETKSMHVCSYVLFAVFPADSAVVPTGSVCADIGMMKAAAASQRVSTFGGVQSPSQPCLFRGSLLVALRQTWLAGFFSFDEMIFPLKCQCLDFIFIGEFPTSFGFPMKSSIWCGKFPEIILDMNPKTRSSRLL